MLEQAGDPTFGGVCPGGVVYNLEVEDPHTYCANGVVAHNCHGAPATTVFRITMEAENAAYRVGLSGTPLNRSDQRSLLTIGALGPIIHEVKPELLIEQGYLSRPIIRMQPIIVASRRLTYAGVYNDCIVRNQKRNNMLVDMMLRAQKPCLTFIQKIDHGRELTSRARSRGLRVEFVWGNRGTAQRDAAIRRLVRNDIDVIVASSVFYQGIDIPELRSVVVGTAGKAAIATLQRIGRGMRVTDDKHTFEVWDILDMGHRNIEDHARRRKHAYEHEGYVVDVESTESENPP
jgi:superfamily II DNA or RNA helicase